MDDGAMDSGPLTYAIGDVHGCAALLDALLERIADHAGDRAHRLVGLHLDAHVADRLADALAHVGVEQGHRQRVGEHHGHLEAAGAQHLGHLQPDVAAAQHHGAAGAGGDRGADVGAVGQPVHAVDTREIGRASCRERV